MAQASTEKEPLAERLSRRASEVLRTELYHAELSLSFVTEGVPRLYRLSIEAPTLLAASGILQAGSARIFATALRDQSNGG